MTIVVYDTTDAVVLTLAEEVVDVVTVVVGVQFGRVKVPLKLPEPP